MPIDHIGLNVQDYARSKQFYSEALKPLGYEVLMEFGGKACGLGVGGKPELWIEDRGEPTIAHVALAAPDRASVDRFYEAAISAGGQDNGPPGLRPHYHESYYGAYVHDPDGNNLEAVCHRAE